VEHPAPLVRVFGTKLDRDIMFPAIRGVLVPPKLSNTKRASGYEVQDRGRTGQTIKGILFAMNNWRATPGESINGLRREKRINWLRGRDSNSQARELRSHSNLSATRCKLDDAKATTNFSHKTEWARDTRSAEHGSSVSNARKNPREPHRSLLRRL
jgi:hypothetical protein